MLLFIFLKVVVFFITYSVRIVIFCVVHEFNIISDFLFDLTVKLIKLFCSSYLIKFGGQYGCDFLWCE